MRFFRAYSTMFNSPRVSYVLEISRSRGQSFANEKRDLAIGPATDASVFVEKNLIEEVADDLSLPNNVFIASVARGGKNNLSALVGKVRDRLAESEQGRGVMPIINDHGCAAVMKNIESPRGRFHVAREREQCLADLLWIEAECPSRSDRRQNVLDLEPDPAVMCEGNPA